MEIQSLGYRTDLIFPKFDGQIIDRGNYLVILTPTNPTYYWGNFLLFASAHSGAMFRSFQYLFLPVIIFSLLKV